MRLLDVDGDGSGFARGVHKEGETWMPCSWQALEVLTDTRQRRLYDEELESAASLSQAFAEQAAGSADQPQFVMSDLKCAAMLLP
jgi:hypothetical protein